MLESCFDADLVTEITLQPVRRHDVDGAILFSDIVVPLVAAGVDVDIVAGVGPVAASPIATAADVAALPHLDAADVGAVARAVKQLRTALAAEHPEVTLIGFAGAPFTLASYLVEGGPSRSHAKTKAFMHAEPALWHELASRLADTAITFLRAQVDAGVQAVQLFDSWAGALSLAEYREFVAPHSARVFAELAGRGVPRIHFGVGTGELLGAMAAGVDVLGVDFRVPLPDAYARAAAAGHPDVALQGNLDPAILGAPWRVVEREVRRVVADADAALARGARGHIFNLGHGVPPGTDPDVLTRVTALVHEL